MPKTFMAIFMATAAKRSRDEIVEYLPMPSM